MYVFFALTLKNNLQFVSFVLNVNPRNTLISYLVQVFQQPNKNNEAHFEVTGPCK